MTRPESHREQQHVRSCGNCRFAHLIAYKLDLLCFHGDEIEIHGQSGYPVGGYPADSDHVYLNGEEIGILYGDEYDHLWASRIVDSEDVCDEWQPEDWLRGGLNAERRGIDMCDLPDLPHLTAEEQAAMSDVELYVHALKTIVERDDEIADLKQTLDRVQHRLSESEQVIGYALTCRSHNTREWMLGFAQRLTHYGPQAVRLGCAAVLMWRDGGIGVIYECF